jgi:hypothetical protein
MILLIYLDTVLKFKFYKLVEKKLNSSIAYKKKVYLTFKLNLEQLMALGMKQ